VKRAFIPTLAVLWVALLLSNCDVLLGPNERAKTGRLVIDFGTEARAAFTPAELESLTYKLALTGPGNQKIEANVSSGKPFNQEVALGEWLIDAEAYNPDNVLVGTGSATVTVQAGPNQARVSMQVVSSEVPVTGVTFGTETLFFVGETATLTAEVTPANATNKNVTWTSSAPAILTVDATGLATAVTAGTATITVTTVDGGFTASCEVTVEPELDPDPVVVTFNADGGSPAIQPLIVGSGGPIGSANMPPEPTKNGYIFDGWYTNKNGGGTLFTDATMVSGDITVYAKWTTGAQ
jgi:uncharacterized repeat protein (TIGR02543 family)